MGNEVVRGDVKFICDSETGEPIAAVGEDGQKRFPLGGSTTPAAVVDALGQMDTEQRGQAGVPMVASGAAADGVTDDTAAINSALQQIRAGGGGTLSLARGVTCFSGLIDVPDGVQLVGHGSGKSGPASVLKATASNAQVRFGSGVSGVGNRGGTSGGFVIDGNGVATNPLRLKLSVQRHFQSIDVLRAAQDGIYIEYAQNNSFLGVNVEDCGRYGWVLDNGAGGNAFYRCEGNACGVAQIAFLQTGTDSLAKVGYAVPTHNGFHHCIFERPGPGSTKTLLHAAGLFNKLDDCVIAGPEANTAHNVVEMSYDGVNLCGPLTMSGGFVQGNTSYCTGFKISNGAALLLRERPSLTNLLAGFNLDTGANLDYDNFKLSSVTSTFVGSGAYNSFARYRVFAPLEVTRYGAADIAMEVAWTDNFPRYRMMGDGSLNWFPGTGYTSDTTLSRTAPGVLAIGATNVFKTGRGATASRPSASAVGAGANFFDTTLNRPIWSNGSSWVDASGAAV